MLRSAVLLWKQGRNKNGISLQRRLFAFFIATTVFIIMLFTAMLLLFDINGNGVKNIENYADGELLHIGKALEADFGKLAVHGVTFSQTVSENIDKYLKREKIPASALQQHPEILTPLLSDQMSAALEVMNKNQCSGTFILLNATVNPDFEDAEYSRAGIFIKSTHPNPVNTVNSKFNYLRGPAEIARENGIELLGQWKMEFNIQNEPFWNEVISTAQRKSDLPLSRLYYWTDCFRLVGNSEAGVLLCVPIRSENGEILGVCGMEVSDRLFKQRYTPNDSGYRNVFTAFAPFKNQTIHIENGMIAGNYFLTGMRMENSMAITHTKNKMSFYQSEDTAYGGLHSEVKLYPNDSPYREQKWLVSVMMPKDIVTAAMNGKSRYLFVIVFLLLLISLFVSIFISKRYLRPVMEAIDSIKTKDYSKKPQKSVYLEINDLMDYLAQQDERLKNNAPAANSMHKIPMFEDFIENLKTLSSAERKVFDLYLEGYKAQEIADKLFLSINTIKTHNRRIFAKLNVSTRKELLVYVDMMKEMNRMSEV